METNKTKTRPSNGTIRKQLQHLLCYVFKNVLESVGHSVDRLKVILIDNGMKLKRMNLMSNVDKCLENFQWDSFQ